MNSLYNKFVHYLYYTMMTICMIFSAVITVGGIYIMIVSMVERMGK